MVVGGVSAINMQHERNPFFSNNKWIFREIYEIKPIKLDTHIFPYKLGQLKKYKLHVIIERCRGKFKKTNHQKQEKVDYKTNQSLSNTPKIK